MRPPVLVLAGLFAAAAAEAAPPKVRYPGPAPDGKTTARPPGVPVATLVLAEAKVEQELGKGEWRPMKQGERVRTGDRLRTEPAGLARIEFPWMSLTAGPGTTLSIPDSVVLYTALEQGRVELLAEGNEIVKLRTPEAEIRGRGRIVVRRDAGHTLVMAMALTGDFRVQTLSGSVEVKGGEGTLVRPQAGAPKRIKLLPPPPGLTPGSDPVYLRVGSEVTLSWKSTASAYYLEIVPLDGEQAVFARELGPPPQKVRMPWLGTYRLRLSARDEQGLEGLPAEGLVCVVEK
jgi:hypothetical protein